MRTMIAAAVLVAFAGVANAAEKAPRGWAKNIPQAQCTADKGLKWVEADEVTSKNTGETKKTAARCAFDSSAANLMAYKAYVGKQ